MQLGVRRRVFFADDEPVQLADSYLPAELAGKAGVDKPDTGPGGTYSRLADIGHAPARYLEDVTCRSPTAKEAAGLELESTQPILEVLLVAYDRHDEPVPLTQHVLPGQQWLLRYEWTAHTDDPPPSASEVD